VAHALVNEVAEYYANEETQWNLRERYENRTNRALAIVKTLLKVTLNSTMKKTKQYTEGFVVIKWQKEAQWYLVHGVMMNVMFVVFQNLFDYATKNRKAGIGWGDMFMMISK